MNVQRYVFDVVSDVAGLQGVPIHAGDLVGSENLKPFVLLRMGVDERSLMDEAVTTTAQIYFHDEPGSWVWIHNRLEEVRLAFANAIAVPGHLGTLWAGNSAQLGDDFYKTIFRYQTYRITWRRL